MAGLFAQVEPTPSQKMALRNRTAVLLGLTRPAMHSYHVTLQYSKKAAPAYIPTPMVRYRAKVASVEVWNADNDDRILVARIDSPPLVARHRSIRKKYGLEWDYASYNPHITLGALPEGADIADALIVGDAKLSGMVLSLGNEATGPIRDTVAGTNKKEQS